MTQGRLFRRGDVLAAVSSALPPLLPRKSLVGDMDQGSLVVAVLAKFLS